MRKIIGVAVFCLVTCSLFLIVQPAFADLVYYGGAWEPLHESGLTIEYNSPEEDYVFGIYDWGNYDGSLSGTGQTSEVLLGHTSLLEGAGLSEAKLNFYTINANTDAAASYVQILMNEGTESAFTKTLWLGTSYEIGFYFADSEGNNVNFFYEYLLSTDSATNSKIYGSVDEPNVDRPVHTINIVHDLIPSEPASGVPIPTAMLLLGSGLVGLAGFKRKMEN